MSLAINKDVTEADQRAFMDRMRQVKPNEFPPDNSSNGTSTAEVLGIGDAAGYAEATRVAVSGPIQVEVDGYQILFRQPKMKELKKNVLPKAGRIYALFEGGKEDDALVMLAVCIEATVLDAMTFLPGEDAPVPPGNAQEWFDELELDKGMIVFAALKAVCNLSQMWKQAMLVVGNGVRVN